MRWLALTLLALLLLLQFRLWFAEGSLAELDRLEAELQRQQSVNFDLQQKNRKLEVEVLELQSGLQSLEERARSDLGMIREGETYYQVVDGPAEPADEGKSE